jgi:hypothetical protein
MDDMITSFLSSLLLSALKARSSFMYLGSADQWAFNKKVKTHKVCFDQGLVLADVGRYQEALERFHSCIRLQTQDPEPLKQVAKCLCVYFYNKIIIFGELHST